MSGLFGSIAFYGTLVTILVFAVPYGTIEPTHKAALVVAISVFGVFRILSAVLGRHFVFAEPVLLSPLAGIVVLAVLQLMPWPPQGSTISRDPYETRSFVLVFGSLIIFAEVLFTYTDRISRLQTLVGLVFIVALGSAAFGFVRQLMGESEFLDAFINAGQGYGQFYNRNHFALLVEMALGLLFGILLKAELSEKVRFIGWVMGGMMIYALIAASSRGGLISLAGISVFAVFVQFLTRNNASPNRTQETAFSGILGRDTILKKVALASGLCVLVFGLIVVIVAFVGGDTVATRMERIGGEVETFDNARLNRNLIWNSTIEMIKARPLMGSGFGAYGTAITAFDTSSGKASLDQAHNDYLEILANGGIAGFALFTTFGVLVVRRILTNLGSADPFRRACTFGASIGIFGVLIHSFVDFGLHILINALVFTLLIVIAAANIEDESKPRMTNRHAV